MELDRLDSRVTWVLAGVPILVTFVQTVTALLETRAASSPLGSVVQPIHDVEVFRQASLVFWDSNELVLALFAVITIAWLVQGAGMFVLRHRDLSFAAAGLVVVLFFALFWGVYSPLLGAIPAPQAALFFATPVFASAFAGTSALTHDWQRDIQERSSESLAAAEQDLERAREGFTDTFDRRIGDPDAYAEVAPNGVERARELRESFHDECDDLASTIEELRRVEEGTPAFEAQATDLRQRVAALDPAARVDQIESALRESLTSGIRTTYGQVSVYTESGDQFTLVNLPSRLRTVEVPALDASVHIGTVDETLLDALDSGTALPTVATAIDQVESHLDEVRDTLAEREASFRSRRRDVADDLDQVATLLDRVDDRVGERLREFVEAGRHDDLTGIDEVRASLESVEELLAACQFEEGERRLDDAREAADELLSTVEFVQAIEGSVSGGATTISIPTRVNPDVVEALVPAIEGEHDVTASVDDGALTIGQPEAAVGSDGTETTRSGGSDIGTPAGGRDGGAGRRDAGGERTADTDPAAGSGSDSDSGPTARPEEKLDAVLYVLRELEEAAGTTAGEPVEFQIDRLPDTIVEPAVLDIVRRFVTRQTDLVTDVSVPDEAPGYIELIPRDTKTGRAVTRALHERYEDRYAGGG